MSVPRLHRAVQALLAALGLGLGLVLVSGTLAQDRDEQTRLEEIQREIRRLELDLVELREREQGVLGEIGALDARLKLREAELEEVTLRLAGLVSTIEARDLNLERLDSAQTLRMRYLRFRLREIYKAGADHTARRLLDGGAAESIWRGLTYASYLSERDGRVLGEFRADARRVAEELEALDAAREASLKAQAELAEARDAVAAARREQGALLGRIRRDQGQRAGAIGELKLAAQELTALIGSLGTGERRELDVRKFKGLLARPAPGRVSAPFGQVVHPRFGTEVPHPGWDIEAPSGTDIRAVFDGTVVYADWMRGYGLTAIVDHGAGLMSIYAHASVLLVNQGGRVAKEQVLGKVGETGSLRGAFLYFELRQDGKPTDPAPWLVDR